MRPVAAARNKLNDLAIHENISQSTMRISPPRASAIRQAVAAMPVFFLPVRVICLVKNAAEPRVSRRLSSGANPISLGRVRGRGPVAVARAGKLVRTAARFNGALPEASTRLPRRAAAVRSREMETKKPAAGLPARAITCDNEPMPVICPTCQISKKIDAGRRRACFAQNNISEIARPWPHPDTRRASAYGNITARELFQRQCLGLIARWH